MSAVAAIFDDAGLHLFADGAFYDVDTGILTAIAPKIHEVPGIPGTVFSSRGRAIHAYAFAAAAAAGGHRTFDELKMGLPAIWALHDQLVEGHLGEVFIAGWSHEAGRAELLGRVTHGNAEGLARGNTYCWTEGRVAFGFSCEALPTAYDADLVAEAFEGGRRHAEDLHCGESETPNIGYSIGGHIDHVLVTPSGASSEQIHCWPDKVGGRIDPMGRVVIR